MQWRVNGYVDVAGLIAEYRKEAELWNRVRDKLDLRVIEIDREALLDDPFGALDRVCGELGLQVSDAARAAAAQMRELEQWVPAGSGSRYGNPIAENPIAENEQGS